MSEETTSEEVTYQIWSPFKFKERICIYGYEGVGKSTAILNTLRYDLAANAWVADLDYSFAYERLIATEYQDVESRVHVFQLDTTMVDFDAMMTGLMTSSQGTTFDQANPETDWLVLDTATVTWGMAQNYWIDGAYGVDDLGLLFAEKRQEAMERVATGEGLKTRNKTVDSEFSADKADMMQWPIVNKIYEDKVLKRLHRWRGHILLICEADAVRRDAGESEREAFGWIGHKPKGQKSLPFVAATNLYFDHPSRDRWRMTTAKDRGRARQDHVQLDNFAFDYLVNVAGWEYAEVEVQGN